VTGLEFDASHFNFALNSLSRTYWFRPFEQHVLDLIALLAHGLKQLPPMDLFQLPQAELCLVMHAIHHNTIDRLNDYTYQIRITLIQYYTDHHSVMAVCAS